MAWFDVNDSRHLEETFSAGREIVVLNNEWGGQDEYNVHNMIVSCLSMGMEKSATRQINRVHGWNSE